MRTIWLGHLRVPVRWVYVPDGARCYWDNEGARSRSTVVHWPERPLLWWTP